MVTIAVFNNKGGVGKTTLTCNLASFIALHMNKRVLVVDCDPQCNSTQLIMGNDASESIYAGIFNNNQRTIYDLLNPILDGDSDISDEIPIIPAAYNRFGVDLIAGHPSFSLIEDVLGAAWHEMRGLGIGGLRKINWNRSLITKLEGEYDYIFYDLGPSLGSINRSVLIGCKYFISPMGADIFSVFGIKNIDLWLSNWIDIYNRSILDFSREAGKIDKYNIAQTIQVRSGFIGYTMQQYITKSKKGERRPTAAYENIIENIPDQIADSVGKYAARGIDPASLNIGDIPHLYSLIPLAQSRSAPILELTNKDRIFGAQVGQQIEYGKIITSIAERLVANIGVAENGLA